MSGAIVRKTEAAIARVQGLGELACRIFTQFDPARILKEAERVDARINSEQQGMPLAGWLVSVKDLFDEAGQRTTAGSRLLATAALAEVDCAVVARLRTAGAVIFGRTSMSEFAYSGVGLNPHFGTPGNALESARIPGGSSSGAALSVAHGLCDAAIGTDTGGSVRIPAAANGLFGLKPSQAAVPMTGVHPLSTTFDSVGSIAKTFDETVAVLSVISGRDFSTHEPQRSSSVRIGVPFGAFVDDLDDVVGESWVQLCDLLASAGAHLEEIDLSFLTEALPIARTIIATEAHKQYGARLPDLDRLGDPRVLRRIRYAETLTEVEISDAYARRAEVVQRFDEALAPVDALMAPTLPILPPMISEVEENFDGLNSAMLRNPSMINIADGCAISVPFRSSHSVFPGAAMFSAPNGRDLALLSTVRSLVPTLTGFQH